MRGVGDRVGEGNAESRRSLRRQLNRSLILWRELQRLHQASDGFPIGVRAAALQLLDAVDTERGSLGQSFLREPSRKLMTPK